MNSQHIAAGSQCLSTYSWSGSPISGDLADALDIVTSEQVGKAFLFRDPINYVAPEIPYIFGGISVSGALLHSNNHRIPIQIIRSFDRQQRNPTRSFSIRPCPFLIGASYSEGGQSEIYEPYDSLTADFDPRALEPDNLFAPPIHFQFYTPVILESISIVPVDGTNQISYNTRRDQFYLSLSLTEIQPLTAFPVLNFSQTNTLPNIIQEF